jgi:hypothetical protein
MSQDSSFNKVTARDFSFSRHIQTGYTAYSLSNPAGGTVTRAYKLSVHPCLESEEKILIHGYSEKEALFALFSMSKTAHLFIFFFKENIPFHVETGHPCTLLNMK